MRLSEVVEDVEVAEVVGDPSVDVRGISYDSRRVAPGDLFCCVSGARHDGHDHVAEAIGRGATALLVERLAPVESAQGPVAVPQVRVASVRVAMAQAAATFHGHPSQSMTVVGITGTNGKTTTAHLLGAIFDEASDREVAAGRPARPVRVLGTLSGERTTPEAPDLQATLAAWRDEGVGVVVMEVSSHALELHRVEAMAFDAAVFTNLSRDHLDFHDSMESYFAAKARLFDPELSTLAVVNLDSPYGRLLRDASTIPTVGYSLDSVTQLTLGQASSSFRWRDQPVELPLGGRFNVANALAAAEAAVALGVPPEVAAAGLSRAPTVPGRFEIVDAGQDFTVVVDYAHTPDGLEQVLTASRELARPSGGEREARRPSGGERETHPVNRVTVVFGCGGDRDPTKRPLMGEVAARMADRVVITADNSRGESTEAIIEAVKEGYARAAGSGRYSARAAGSGEYGARAAGSGERGEAETASRASELVVEPDRRAAIAAALRAARPGDVVLIAGKGHESTLTIGDEVTDFDDRVVAREELERLGRSGEAGS